MTAVRTLAILWVVGSLGCGDSPPPPPATDAESVRKFEEQIQKARQQEAAAQPPK